MEMENRLSRQGAVVGKDVESFKLQAAHQPTRDLAEGSHHAVEGIRRQLHEFCAVPFGYDERMTEMDRTDIKYADGVLVFVKDLGRLGSSDNPAKNTVGDVHGRLRTSDPNLSKKGPKVKEPSEVFVLEMTVGRRLERRERSRILGAGCWKGDDNLRTGACF